MNTPYHTKTFKSGNSVAVRLPRGFAIPANAEVELEKSGDTITLRFARNPKEARRRMREAWEAIGAPEGGVQTPDREQVRRELEWLVADLAAIGWPDDGIQARPDFEAPEVTAESFGTVRPKAKRPTLPEMAAKLLALGPVGEIERRESDLPERPGS